MSQKNSKVRKGKEGSAQLQGHMLCLLRKQIIPQGGGLREIAESQVLTAQVLWPHTPSPVPVQRAAETNKTVCETGSNSNLLFTKCNSDFATASLLVLHHL